MSFERYIKVLLRRELVHQPHARVTIGTEAMSILLQSCVVSDHKAYCYSVHPSCVRNSYQLMVLWCWSEAIKLHNIT